MPKEHTPEIVAGYNIAPLRKLLKKWDQIVQGIEEAEQQEPALRKEIDDYLDRINPRDQEAVKLIRVKQDMLEMVPIYLKKWQRELAEVEEKIRDILDPLEDVIGKLVIPEREAVIAKASETIRPFVASDAVAARFAVQFDLVSEIGAIAQTWRDISNPAGSAKRGIEIIDRYLATGSVCEKKIPAAQVPEEESPTPSAA